MKNEPNVIKGKINDLKQRRVKMVLILGLLSVIALYFVNFLGSSEFDTSELIASDSIAVDEMVSDHFPIKIHNEEFVGILIEEVQRNRFIESDEWLSEPTTHILFLQGTRREGNIIRQYTISSYLNSEGEMIIYDKLVSKHYKGKISKELVKQLNDVFLENKEKLN